MKTQIIYRSALFGALLLTASAQAQNTAPVEIPPPVADADAANRAVDGMMNSDLFQCYVAATKELTPIWSNNHIKSKLAQIKRFDFSAETKQKLLHLYGNDRPLHFQTKTSANGDAEVSYILDELTYQDPNGRTKTHIAALTGKSVYRKHNTQYRLTSALPSVHVDVGNDTQMYAHDLTYAESKALANSGLWFGTGEFKLGHLSVDVSSKNLHLKIDDTAVRTEVKKRGRLVDVEVDSVTKSINWGGDGIGPVHAAYRISNIDSKAIASFAESEDRVSQSKMPDDARAATTLHMFSKLGIAALKGGAAIDIQDISVQYHGMTAGLDGRVAFDKVQDADLDSFLSLLPKLNLHISLHAPKELLMEVSRRVVRSKLAASANQGVAVTEHMVESAAQDATNKLLELPLKEKWIRVEHGALLSSIDFKAGKLTVNGEAFRAPTSK
jgi:hypothetical protein